MMKSSTNIARLLLFLLPIVVPSRSHAKPKPPPDRWVGTWATAPIPYPNTDLHPNLHIGIADTTLRESVHTSLPGTLVRVELTNEFGTEPLTLGAVHIALAAAGGSIALASANAMTFHGSPTVTIPPGAIAISDPAALNLPAGADLAVSLFVPAQTIAQLTIHSSAFTTNYLAPGNCVGTKSLALAHPTSMTSWYFLKSVDVMAPAATGAIVAFGDSITDGDGSTLDLNARWPDVLSQRLQTVKPSHRFAVLNEGIAGNRVLHEGIGPSALARFDRDVLAQPGVRSVILLEGINDIGHAHDPVAPYDVVSADDLIAGLTQLAQRAHAQGIQVIGATLTPYLGAGYSSPTGEAIRQSLNAWIRSSRLFDGVIDFDKITEDPTHPNHLRPDLDHGDHLHPSDAGYKAMGDAIDLTLFEAR